MNKNTLNIFLLVLGFLLGVPAAAVFAQTNDETPAENGETEPSDSAVSKKYPVHHVTDDPYTTGARSTIDLENPENYEQVIEYDPITGQYIVRNKIGENYVGQPATMSFNQYKDYDMRQSLNRYWAEKNSENRKKKGGPLELSFDLGPAGAIFGEGGVQIKPQGYAELSFGVKTNRIDNFTLPERLRKTTVFDFDQKVQMNINGTVGDKIKMGMTYNTEATFDFDNKINLNYAGKEDDIIKKIEAGNVSLPLGGSLIQGSQSLFGFKTELQFGKLRVNAVFSQQESETQTMNIEGGAATTEFEIKADEYDANRNFFLSHFFEQNYDKWMKTLPVISSKLKIRRVEVWVTNKRGSFEEARHIIPFVDLGEPERANMHKPNVWQPSGATRYPSNRANNLYQEVTNLNGIRNISQVSQVMDSKYGNNTPVYNGEDWEKVESARRLSSNEYYVNTELGYISLKSSLNNDEIVAVAFEYDYDGVTYQVGEFSTHVATPQTLVVKMLKGTTLTPAIKTWDLMMKNVYYLNSLQINREDFRLNLFYLDDKTGTELNYVPAGNISQTLLLRVMGLDRLNTMNEPGADGFFDWVEGYTIIPSQGKIIFPTTKPFHMDVLGDSIGDSAIAAPYVFNELYDSSLTVAKEFTTKNKYHFEGYYKSASGSEIKLQGYNIPRGSVKVTAGGRTLVENVDYTVDYNSGYLKIINPGLLESGNNIQVSLENQSTFSMVKKTMMGTHLDYQFSEDVNVGATLMHLYERPLTQKVNMGNDPISNTIWGMNGAVKKELPFLTRWVDALPFIETKAPSRFSFKGEVAQIIPGHSNAIGGEGAVYIDDFESTKIGIDIRPWHYWKLASVPSVFDEYNYINSLEHGKNRAKIAWYRIDRMFQDPNSQTPGHIRDDAQMRSNHYVRAVNERNLFPNKDNAYGEPTIMPVLDVSYYPTERGQYNLDIDNVDPNTGKFTNPKDRWGGMMQRIDGTDFETSNVMYIEFWVMDPFIYDKNNRGKMVFNLGNVSEDILRDGRKGFEHGLPLTDDLENDETVEANAWGYVPLGQSMVVAFENDEASRVYQDVGIDGINSDKEASWPGYRDYTSFLNTLNPSSEYVQHLKDDVAQDDYQYFRGSTLDSEQANIFERYKNYNNIEGNSPTEGMSQESYATAATKLPDLEDLNQDNTLNENESYYEYEVDLDPYKMVVGQNRIVDTKQENVVLANGVDTAVNWYQFKIPIQDFDRSIGEIRDFRSIRFMRMYLTDFEREVHLRFATFQLVRGEWRSVKTIMNDADDLINKGTQESLEIEAVNIEENAAREPVNYVLPPDVDRVIDPGQPQLRQLNEQAMVMRVKDLEAGNAKAAFKTLNMDLRQFKKLQLWVHAEKLPEMDATTVNTELQNGDLEFFIRMGSDFSDNYYEYSVPLQLTPEGFYDNANIEDRKAVWPEANRLDFPLQDLVNLKLERNRLSRGDNGEILYTRLYDKLYGADGHRMGVIGNPTVSRVQSILVGVRNVTAPPNDAICSGEVWINEFRLSSFNEDGGWAGLANMTVQFADLGSVNLSGRKSTTGWGGIEQKLMERQLEDITNLDMSTNVQLGKFFPQKAKVNLPVYYSYSKDMVDPKYNPLDEDVLLTDALANTTDQEEKQRIEENAQQVVERKSLNFTNVKVGISGEKKQFFDPNNFSANFSYSETKRRDPKTEREITKNYRGGLAYNYSPDIKPFTPLNSVKAFDGDGWQLIRDFNLSYFPQQLSFRSDMIRNYNEMQLRNLAEQNSAADLLDIPVAVRKDWFWNSTFDLNYNLTNSISLTFSAKTFTIVDEPTIINDRSRQDFGDEIVLDKDRYASMYEFWKDSVMTSIMNFGRVTQYNQNFNARYDVPLSKVPILNWMTMDMAYGSSYNFERGPQPFTIEDSLGIVETHNLQHFIRNTQVKTINGSMNFLGLFNKSEYLRNINRKYRRTRSSSSPGSVRYKTVKFEKKNVSFKKGEAYTINHKLKSKKVTIRIYDENDRPISGDREEVDEMTARFTPSRDKEKGRILVTARVEDKDSKSQVIIGQTLRFLMMPENFGINYSENNSSVVPGFREVGHMGQSSGAPGLEYAFGSQNQSFITKAHKNEWLTKSSQLNDRYIFSNSKNLKTKLSLQPVNNLKINLNWSWSHSEVESAFYRYEDQDYNQFNSKVNYNQNGNFTMTWMALGVPWKINDGDYSSEPFTNLTKNREIVAKRLASQRASRTKGLYKPGASGYNGYSLNSSEVLIPSFMAAYGMGDAETIDLTAFPEFYRMLPNWSVSYNGLSKLDFFKKYFRSITLNHRYQSTYSVGSFATNPGYMDLQNAITPLSGYDYFLPAFDITSVTITESFSPLISLDMAFKNSLTSKLEYRKMRTLNMNVSSSQLVEMATKEFIVGAGYRWDNFNMIINSGGKSKSVNNDLNIRADLSWRDIKNLIRELDRESFDENGNPVVDENGNPVMVDGTTQPTSGQNVFSIKFSADYVLSRSVNVRLFYDRMLNKPLISSSFTTGSSNFGVAFRFTLAN